MAKHSAFQEWESLSTREFFEHTFGRSSPRPGELDEWRRAETQAFLSSDLFAMRNYLYITLKERGDLVKLHPWTGQMSILICRESQRRRGLSQKIVEIKSRQLGWTTIDVSLGLIEALRPNRRVSIMVKEERVADDLSQRIATMYNNLPTHFKPMNRINNLKFLIFDNPNSFDRTTNPGLNSTFSITTPSAQRGRTPHFCVGSEFAFWTPEQQGDFMEGLVGAMGMSASFCVILDTTPNGFDEVYYPTVMEAVENNPKWVKSWTRKTIPTMAEMLSGEFGEPDHPEEGFVPAFWPWHWHPEYTTKNEDPRAELPKVSAKRIALLQETLGKLEKYGGDEEVQLMKEQGCSIYRIYWRRRKIDSYKQQDVRLRLLVFRQEYCTTWEGCFVTYEMSPFDPICLDYLCRQGKEPAARGLLKEDAKGVYIDSFARTEHEEVRIYAPPTGSEKYVMGVDTAQAFESEGGDSHFAVVVRVSDQKVVAVYQGRVPGYRLRDQLHLLYQWYNRCYYAIEVENIGYQLVRDCIDLGMANTYYWKRLDAALPDESKFPGWESNVRTRPIMEDCLLETINHRAGDQPDPLLICHDREVLRQIAGLKRDNDGTMRGGRTKDDGVMALMIALAIQRDTYFPYRQRHKEETRMELNALIAGMGYRVRPDRNHPELAQL